MTPKEFFDKVAAMRNAQKEYFKTRSAHWLSVSKTLENEVDSEIARANKIMEEKSKKEEQTMMFSCKNCGRRSELNGKPYCDFFEQVLSSVDRSCSAWEERWQEEGGKP